MCYDEAELAPLRFCRDCDAILDDDDLSWGADKCAPCRAEDEKIEALDDLCREVERIVASLGWAMDSAWSGLGTLKSRYCEIGTPERSVKVRVSDHGANWGQRSEPGMVSVSLAPSGDDLSPGARLAEAIAAELAE